MLFFLNMMMNVAVLWTNDVVHIPLGDNLDNYKHHPQATLYLNDEEVIDRLMYYEYELHYTSFNVIRTHIVGSYTVWYRAHFPTLGFESDMAITFVVYDHIAPSILRSEEHTSELQSRPHLVCRLLLEKKKKKKKKTNKKKKKQKTKERKTAT